MEHTGRCMYVLYIFPYSTYSSIYIRMVQTSRVHGCMSVCGFFRFRIGLVSLVVVGLVAVE